MPDHNETVTARFNARQSENQSRVLQRDGYMLAALTVLVVAYTAQEWAVFVPILLAFLASRWLQHDRRVGQGAAYLRRHVEPNMKDIDGVMGWEEFLDQEDNNRSRAKWFHFNSATARLYFPTLQMAVLVYSWVRYSTSNAHQTPLWIMVVGSVVSTTLTVLTFAKVKHIRQR